MTAYPDIIEVTAQDREALAALLWIETRGFDDGERIDAGYSVLSTVMTRTIYRLMSDGTIAGTFNHECYPDSLHCEFPAYAYNGCEGIIPALCPFNSPSELPPFRAIVDLFFDAGKRGSCNSYLFYGSREDVDPDQCVIRDAFGSFINFHKQMP